MKSFEAEEKSIRNLFGERLSYYIPSYQRPYSWGKDEVEKFCEDILQSYLNCEEEYFLSSIILVEKNKEKLYEVIDGQQRLTTISIFLAVLKEFITELDLKEDISNRILNGNEVRVQKVRTDKSFHNDFQDVLQNFSYETFKDLIKKRKYRKNPYYKNAICIYEFLSSDFCSNIDFNQFYENYFIDSVYLIRVYTTQESRAMRLFEVLNSRGLPLRNSDLIKNHIMERLFEIHEDEHKQKEVEAFEETWKEMRDNLDSLGESIEDLFTYYVYMKLGENPKNNLFEEFKLILKNEFDIQNLSIQDFTAEFYTFYKTFISIFSEEKPIDVYRKIHSMKYLREGRFWKTILTSFKLQNKSDDLKELVDILFQFYYLNYLAGESVNPYKQLSFNAIKSIKQGTFSLPSFNDEITKYYERQKTILRFKSNIEEDVYGENWSKIIFYLIEYFKFKEKEDYEIFEKNNKKIQIEHIFPRNHTQWSNATDLMIESKNKLGNLLLLFQSSNIKCSNKPFSEKKIIYEKNSHKFAHSKEILKYEVWDEQTIENRQQILLKQIGEIFGVEL